MVRKCIFLGFRSGIKGYILLDWFLDIFSCLGMFNFMNSVFLFIILHFLILLFLQFHCHKIPLSQDTPSLDFLVVSPTAHFTTQESSIDAAVLVARRSTTQQQSPTYLRDYHYALLSLTQPPSSISLGTSPHSLDFVLSYNHLSPSYKHFILSISSHFEPKTYNQVVKHEIWHKSMAAEILALKHKNA